MVTALRQRGVVRTAQSASDLVEDWWFERRFGVATSGNHHPDELDIESDNREFAQVYQPSRVGHVRRVLERLPIERADWTLVDYGSGKGRVLLVGSMLGFGRVIGVEFAADLCRAAEGNQAAFEDRRGRPSGIEIVHADAARLAVPAGPTVFHAFHPFDAQVQATVVDNIVAARALSPQPGWFCYTDPPEPGLIDAMPGAERFAVVDWGGEETLIWKL